MINFLSLFSGIGGFELGLERAGMECVGQVEIDDYCNKVLEKHWPNVKRERDIRNVTGETFGAVGLICGGFPCQPFSVAGKQAGKGDDRYLWPEMLRVIEAYRPTWVIGENVAGIISMALDTVISEMERIGYEVQCFIIPASGVNARHRRDRVWIVAYSDERRRNTQPLSCTERISRENNSDAFKSSEDVGYTRLLGQEINEKQTARFEQSSKDVADTTDSRTEGMCERKISTDEDVADSECNTEGSAYRSTVGKRERGWNEQDCSERNKMGSDTSNGSEDVANTGEAGLQGVKNTGSIREVWKECDEQFGGCNKGKCNEGQSQSRLGRVVDGLSERLDRIGIEPDIPRVTTVSKNRAKRLKALGNAVVPLVPEIIGRAIIEVECNAI